MLGAPKARVSFISGKGGVGKSSVACAMALALADRGLRVLLVELSGASNCATFLGVRSGTAQPREVLPELFLMNLAASDAVREYAQTVVRLPGLANLITQNRVLTGLLQLLPALNESVMLGKLFHHGQSREDGGDDYDHIIVDAPSTGHAIALLEAPKALAAMIPTGPMRANAEAVSSRITDPTHCRLVVVATPDAAPLEEAATLLRAAASLGLPGYPVALNHIRQRFTDNTVSAADAQLSLRKVAGYMRHENLKVEHDRSTVEAFQQDTGASVIPIPESVTPPETPEALGTWATHLASLLTPEDWGGTLS